MLEQRLEEGGEQTTQISGEGPPGRVNCWWQDQLDLLGEE